MSTLTEIQEALPQFSAEELARLEQIVRETRREKEGIRQSSLGAIQPVSVGRILQALGGREEWYDEMPERRG